MINNHHDDDEEFFVRRATFNLYAMRIQAIKQDPSYCNCGSAVPHKWGFHK